MVQKGFYVQWTRFILYEIAKRAQVQPGRSRNELANNNTSESTVSGV